MGAFAYDAHMRNFRDLSYLGLKEGKLLRSDVLYHLSFKEKRLLKKHGLHLVVDLRRPEEAEKLKDSKIFRVKYINFPLLNAETGENPDQKRSVVIRGVSMPDMAFYYRDFANPKREAAWTKLFDMVLNEEKAILFHCSAGKDRTGAVIAMILMAVGIDKETVYQDYLLTNENRLFYQDLAEKKDQVTKEVMLEHLKAKREYLDGTFEEIEKNYGSVDAFLYKACGLTAEKRQKLKEKLLPNNK